jgi:hypothetical protein
MCTEAVMRSRLVLAALVASLAIGLSATHGGEKPVAKQIQIDMALKVGDPLGSKGDGVKYLAEPKLVILAGRPGTLGMSDEENLTILSTLAADGAIHLNVRSEQTLVLEKSKDRTLEQVNRITFDRDVQPGEVVKLRLTKAGEMPVRWIEMSARAVEPLAP